MKAAEPSSATAWRSRSSLRSLWERFGLKVPANKDLYAYAADDRESASVAHISGQNLVAESMTAAPDAQLLPDGRAQVSVELPPFGSSILVFSRIGNAVPTPALTTRMLAVNPLKPWKITFEANGGAPENSVENRPSRVGQSGTKREFTFLRDCDLPGGRDGTPSSSQAQYLVLCHTAYGSSDQASHLFSFTLMRPIDSAQTSSRSPDRHHDE
jgi:hypothetical protein